MAEDIDLIKAIGSKFIQRRDAKAVQAETNSKGDILDWKRLSSPFKLQDFKDHLAGTRTFGHYLVDHDGKCKLFAFDIDLNKTGELVSSDGDTVECNPREVFLTPDHWGRPQLIMELQAMAEGLGRRIVSLLGIPVAIHFSGNKGLHVYGFTGETNAVYAKEAAVGVLKSFPDCFEAFKGENFYRHTHSYKNITIETFPKQIEINEDGYGNLMSLPLGLNRKSGAQKMFLGFRGELEVLREFDPIRALSGDLPWE